MASFGETKAEALLEFPEALALHAGEGSPVTDADLQEFGLVQDDAGEDEVPEFMQ